ncbi:putative CCR4-associated factor 1-like protein 9 [Dichanthelium oligosanthes]|uniref:Putative CCR4-associated factor 1-like protein 9 n=1 Tax=Dichanthelium oligosanthes TaxID=888268 RepID=A0A1E5V427_9POAL|nr:putative CCR4-associated factor 1-like protein 9 [Dichanthelium oligosanthes]
MFPLAPPRLFQPFPPPAPHAAVPFFAHAAQLPQPPPPHAAVPYNNGGVVGHAVAPPPVFGLHIRPVTAANYEAELDAIGFLLTRFPFVAIDTEYPGTLGITLCDEFGNLPVVFDSHGRPFELAWEATFSDFDARRDRHAPESVAFLRSQGVDFDLARARGVSSAAFAAKLAAVLSSMPQQQRDELTWAAFGGAYDFAYVVKMLAGGRTLPETWHEFAPLARALLGGRVFDAKYMAEHCERADLCRGGGLSRVAAILDVQPNNFQCLAGRKSHRACRVFTAMRRRILYQDGGARHEGFIDGLHR